MVAETTMPRFCFIHYIIYVDYITYLFTDETCPCDSLSPWVRFTQNSMKKNFPFLFVVGVNLPSGKDNFWLMFYLDNFRSKIIIYLTETINKVA